MGDPPLVNLGLQQRAQALSDALDAEGVRLADQVQMCFAIAAAALECLSPAQRSALLIAHFGALADLFPGEVCEIANEAGLGRVLN